MVVDFETIKTMEVTWVDLAISTLGFYYCDGSETEYNTNADKAPIIILLLPIYHLIKKSEKTSK